MDAVKSAATIFSTSASWLRCAPTAQKAVPVKQTNVRSRVQGADPEQCLETIVVQCRLRAAAQPVEQYVAWTGFI